MGERPGEFVILPSSELYQLIEKAVRAALKAENDTHAEGAWIDQDHSALGPRRHCAAVRRRLAQGKTDAEVIGRKHRLRADAYAEERALVGQGRLARCEAPGDAEEDAAYHALKERIDGQ